MYLRNGDERGHCADKATCSPRWWIRPAHKGDILPGYTHLQRAQPITFGHHLMAYAMMLLRDIDRMQDAVKRMNVSPIGCCASPARRMTPTAVRPNSFGFDDVARNSLTACPTGTSASSCSMLTPSR